MNDKVRLIAAFREMRTDDGVTLDKLNKRRWMFELLLVSTAEQARVKLDELIGVLGDGLVARSVRVALAIGEGLEAHVGVVERRRQATATPAGGGRAYIERSPRTLSDYEDKIGFPALADLILDRRAEALVDPFTDAVSQAVEDDDQDEPAAAEEAPLQPHRRRLQKMRLAYLALAFVAAVATTVTPFVLEGRSGQAASLPHVEGLLPPPRVAPVNGSSASREGIDNTAGWGPGRKTYSVNSPPPYAVFNSITDQSTYGDERQFLQCRDKDRDDWSMKIAAEDDHVYICWAWFANDVAPNFDQGNPAAQLQNVRIRISTPKNQPVYNPHISAYLMADNAATIWASCNFVAEKPVHLYYVPRSTFLITKAIQDAGLDRGRLPMKETANEDGGITEGITTDNGALLGARTQDGIVRQANGWVQFAIRVRFEH
ncbi:hypothetical protein ACFWN1_14985 [Streptomyces sp. NPDC058459]|uniref:hypothetical protein n=1 Tax=Streptomyces sp. NPDC058459 TaxID=3346508 RepID=UPI003656F360